MLAVTESKLRMQDRMTEASSNPTLTRSPYFQPMNVQQCSLYSFMITTERYMHKSIFFLIERFISKGYDFNIVVKSLNPDFPVH
jgi:hypothetical protein